MNFVHGDTFWSCLADTGHVTHRESMPMNNIIYIVGLIVVVIAVLSFFGLR